MKLKKDAPLQNLLTLKVKDAFCDLYLPDTIDDVVRFTAEFDDFLVLGGGSNIVAGKIKKPVLYMSGIIGTSNTEDISENAVKTFLPAGISISRLLDYSIKNGLSGVEFMAGIPGTVGGALFGNAAPKEHSWDDVAGSLYIVSKGAVSMLIPEFGYRKFLNPPQVPFVIYGVDLILIKDTTENVRQRVMYYLSQRLRIKHPSAGSLFKNPGTHIAGKLLDEAGMKGFSVNDAALSSEHANIVINKGEACFKDFCKLRDKAVQKVEKMHKIKLETEVKFWNE
jgi:UDP-N-acetylmuramate dehydrogenase